MAPTQPADTMSWKGASILLETHKQMKQLFKAADAQVEELKQRVEALEEEKLQAKKDSRLLTERISELEDELESSFLDFGPNTTNEKLQAQNAKSQELIEALKRELDIQKRKNTALSYEVGTSSKNAPASTNLHKQYVKDLKGENLRLVKRLEEREANARTQAAQLQQTIDGLERENSRLDSRLNWALHYKQRNEVQEIQDTRVPFLETGTASAQDLVDALTEVERLRTIVDEQQSVIEQKEQRIEEYSYAEAQASVRSDLLDSPIPEDSAYSQEGLGDLGTPSIEADGPETSDVESSASDSDDPEIKQPQLEAENQMLRLQNRELEDKNRSLQEKDTKWRKIFKKFLQRAADVQRKDASKHQIKKGFKDLHKIVKEGELHGL